MTITAAHKSGEDLSKPREQKHTTEPPADLQLAGLAPSSRPWEIFTDSRTTLPPPKQKRQDKLQHRGVHRRVRGRSEVGLGPHRPGPHRPEHLELPAAPARWRRRIGGRSYSRLRPPPQRPVSGRARLCLTRLQRRARSTREVVREVVVRQHECGI